MSPYVRATTRNSRTISIQDALRLFFKPTRTGDPRTDFYSVYQKEATEYDTNFVKRYEENLDITLIFVSPITAKMVSLIYPATRLAYSLAYAQHLSSVYSRS